MADYSLISYTEARKAGRPRLIQDFALQNRFTSLLGFFEYHWAEVAWDLSEAKTIPVLREALRRAKRESVSELEPFVTEPTSRTTNQELKELRCEERKLNALSRSAYEEQRLTSERLERAIHAVNAHRGDERLQKLKTKHEQRYASTQNQLAALKEASEKLEERIKQKEAFFAQSELLEFVRSNRYTLSPVSFAKAMAGLPWITWRQSAARLAKSEIKHPFGVEYEKFRIVQKALEGAPRKLEKMIAAIKAVLLRKSNCSFAYASLRDEWYFLKSAIETISKQRVPRTAVPFRVYAEYQRKAQYRSAADVLLQEDEALL